MLNKFKAGDTVVFRESETGAPEKATVTEVIPANESHPNGGLYVISLDTAPGETEAWEYELSRACKNCGEDIALDDGLGDWFHSHRADLGEATDMHCDASKPFAWGNYAEPA